MVLLYGLTLDLISITIRAERARQFNRFIFVNQFSKGENDETVN